jgi:hypothetical protein
LSLDIFVEKIHESDEPNLLDEEGKLLALHLCGEIPANFFFSAGGTKNVHGMPN